jgi:hypothetical protein
MFKLMTPVAVAAFPKEAPLHESLKSVASSCVAVAAARRNEALSSFMSENVVNER